MTEFGTQRRRSLAFHVPRCEPTGAEVNQRSFDVNRSRALKRVPALPPWTARQPSGRAGVHTQSGSEKNK